MDNYKKNLKLLTENHVYSKEMEHDACGVGLIASTEGKKSRAVVEYGIEALKAVWHRGAIDADGKTGDGAGIHVEIPKDFFIEKIEVTGHDYDKSEICIGMIFLPRNRFLQSGHIPPRVQCGLSPARAWHITCWCDCFCSSLAG